MPTTAPTEVPPEWLPWVLGLLLLTISVLGGVVGYLFKLYNRRVVQHEKQNLTKDADHTAERNHWLEEKAAWDAEREAEHARLALGYETKARELAESYIKQSALDRTQHLQREDQTRKDAQEMVDRVTRDGAAAANKMADILQKMHDRFQGGRPSRRPGPAQGG
jgi:hypothetical protein